MTSNEISADTAAESSNRKVSFSVFSQLDGKRYRVVVREADIKKLRVEKIKRNLLKVTSIPVEDQVIFAENIELSDNMVGEDFNLNENSILVLYTKSKPVKQEPEVSTPPPPQYQPPLPPSLKIETSLPEFNSSNDANNINAPTEQIILESTIQPPSSLVDKKPSSPLFQSKYENKMNFADEFNSSKQENIESLMDFSSIRRSNSIEPESPQNSQSKAQIWQQFEIAKQMWEREKEALIRRFEQQLEQKLEEERMRLNRIWAMEKKEILKKANDDRQELMQENSRLRKEMSFNGNGSLESKSFEDEREVLIKRIAKLDDEKQELKSTISQLEKKLEIYRMESDDQIAKISQNHKEEIYRLTNQLKSSEAENYRLSKDVEKARIESGRASGMVDANIIEIRIKEAIKREKQVWEQEKQAILKNWKEENEILTFINKETKETWKKEKDELHTRFEKEKQAAIQEYSSKAERLSEEAGNLLTELQKYKDENLQLQEESREAKSILSRNSLFVQSANNAIADLKNQIQQLLQDPNTSNLLVELTTQKSMEKKKSEKLEQENIILREKLLEETKKRKMLHNQIEDWKGNIRVVIRMRPLLTGEMAPDINIGKVEVRGDGNVSVTNASNGTKYFEFFRALDDSSSQNDVFEEVRPLIQSAVDGYNVCILAYGQTGTGKTYTIYGDPTINEYKGIVPRAVEELFLMLQKHNIYTRAEDKAQSASNFNQFMIKCSMVELYLDSINDLFDKKNSDKNKLEIRQHPSGGGVFIPGLTEIVVNTPEDLLNLLIQGNSIRQVHKTDMNQRSSRSHSIFTIGLHITTNIGNRTVTTKSKVQFVDLAGSERVSRSHSAGDRFKEAQHINKSLSCLGDVISALSQKQSFVPYRNAKLTLLLQDSIGGSAKTIMFANISPDAASVTETISTLNFAARVKKVQNFIVKNVQK